MGKAPSAVKKKLCFVVGPIGKDGSLERKHADLMLNAVIKEVLHGDEFDYHVKRADEDADPGMIGDRVITDIINADLVVADLTDLNPNAFYELGIRHSTERATIHIAKHGTPLPFDNVAHRTIFVDLGDWQSIESARVRLRESVKATEAPGYKVSNPITQANASFKMRQSEDPRDQVLSTIQDRLDAVEKYQTQTTKPNEVRIYEDASPVTLLRTLIERAQAYAENGVSLSMIRQRIPELASQRGIALDKFSIDESGTMIIGYGGSGTVIQLNLSDQKPR